MYGAVFVNAARAHVCIVCEQDISTDKILSEVRRITHIDHFRISVEVRCVAALLSTLCSPPRDGRCSLFACAYPFRCLTGQAALSHTA